MGPHSKSGWLTQICLVLWGGCTYMQVNAHVCMFAGVHVCTPPHTHMWGYVCVHSCEDREQLNHSSGAIHLVLLLQSLSLVWNSAMSPGRLTTEPRGSPLLGSPMLHQLVTLMHYSEWAISSAQIDAFPLFVPFLFWAHTYLCINYSEELHLYVS